MLKRHAQRERGRLRQRHRHTKVASFATDVGMVFQDPEARSSIRGCATRSASAWRTCAGRADEILSRQKEALAFVGLSMVWRPLDLRVSGGQKQRVSIAAVLAARPRLLVLDEPTANLDPGRHGRSVRGSATPEPRPGTTIVMVEHRVDELADRVSRVVMMDRGAIVFDGSPREAFSTRRVVQSEEAAPFPAASWFPQVSEFAIDLAAASRSELPPPKCRFPSMRRSNFARPGR